MFCRGDLKGSHRPAMKFTEPATGYLNLIWRRYLPSWTSDFFTESPHKENAGVKTKRKKKKAKRKSQSKKEQKEKSQREKEQQQT